MKRIPEALLNEPASIQADWKAIWRSWLADHGELTGHELFRFFNGIRRSRSRILTEFGSPLAFCDALIHSNSTSTHALKIESLLARKSSDLRDYQIASAYALLMDGARRKELSAYFTPPTLTSAALSAATPFLIGKKLPTILDPACGGGAFLVPLARLIAKAHKARGMSAASACVCAIEQLNGIEIDEGLVTAHPIPYEAAAVAAPAARVWVMAAIAVRPLRRPVATIEQISA